MKQLEENTGQALQSIKIAVSFKYDTKAQATKAKIHKWNCIKPGNVCRAKET